MNLGCYSMDGKKYLKTNSLNNINDKYTFELKEVDYDE
jgi:hypothetical protein